MYKSDTIEFYTSISKKFFKLNAKQKSTENLVSNRNTYCKKYFRPLPRKKAIFSISCFILKLAIFTQTQETKLKSYYKRFNISFRLYLI